MLRLALIDLVLLFASLVMHGAVIASLHSTLRIAKRTFAAESLGRDNRKPAHIPA
jgi:hypothetical protein